MSNNISEIRFRIGMDENQIPEAIEWHVPGEEGKGSCDAAFLTIWDRNEKNTLRIDLWTKDMMVDDMQIFFHQMLLSMSDTYKRATGDDQIAKDLKQFALEMGEKMGIIKKNN